MAGWARRWVVLTCVGCLVLACRNSSAPVQQASTSTTVGATIPNPEPVKLGAMSAVWESRARCQGYFKNRPVRDPSPRLATWNLRWFPDGTPEVSATPATDIEWLACVLSSLEIDVLAVQEVKKTPSARLALEHLLAVLSQLTGATFLAELDRCPLEDDQHVGFIYNSARVSADKWQDYPTLNPYGVACEGRLRTGFGGYFRFANGPDMSLISAHLKSGPDQRSYNLRRRSLAGMNSVFQRAYAAEPDDDVLLLGDLNTMGCSECVPAITAAAELEVLTAELQGLAPRFGRLPPDLACSEYYQGNGILLDHVLATEALAEFPAGALVQVSGHCGEAKCARVSTPAAAYTGLSDHCPLVIELVAEDRD